MSKTLKQNYMIDDDGVRIGLPRPRHQRRICGRKRGGLHRLQRLALPVMPATGYAGSLGTQRVDSQRRIWPRLVWVGVWRDGPSPWSRGYYLHVPEAGKGGVSHRVYPRDGAGYVARDAVEVGGRRWRRAAHRSAAG